MSLKKKFWKDDLLCDYDNVIKKAANITMDEMIKNSKYTARVLSIFLSTQGDRRDLLKKLIQDDDKLKVFLLLEEFAKSTLKDVVAKVIEGNLNEYERRKVLKERQQGVREYNKYDKFAGVIILYQKNPELLMQIRLLTLVNIRGSQNSFLIEIIDRKALINNLNSEVKILTALEHFDSEVNDEKRSKFLSWFEHDNELYLFFLRQYKRTMLRTIESANFETECEWIVIRINSSLEQVKVSFQSKINIRRFVSILIGTVGEIKSCQDKEVVKEMLEINPINEVQKFLKKMLESHSSPLIEIRFEPSPIRGGPLLMLSDRNNKSLRNAFRWFMEKRVDLLKDISIVKECKIYYKKHRLRLKLECVEDGIIIRYVDKNLVIHERNKFERFMKEKYGLGVIPGVKS